MSSGQTNEYRKKYERAVGLYNRGKSTTEISRLLKIDNGTLRKNLRLDGFEVKDSNINESIYKDSFTKIKTEEQAYWLGMLYADGWVSKDCNRIALCLKDKEHVKKFAKFLNIEANKVKRKIIMDKHYYNLQFRNKQIHDDLIGLGCIPQKSLTLKFPEFLPSNLINHFVRGYFDGDGSIGIYSNKGAPPCPQVSLLGTKQFLEKIICNYNLPKNKFSRCGKAYQYATVRKKSVKYFLNSLYKNSNIYLNRKHKIFNNCRFE